MQTKILITFILLVCCKVSVSFCQIDRIPSSNFPSSSIPDTLYIVYDNDHTDEELFLIQSIQGIVAKEKPMIFRNRGGGSAIWQDDLVDNYEVTAIDSLSGKLVDLLLRFSSSFNGYILCNAFDNSSNAAISIAGITKCITVPESLQPLVDSLGFQMMYDVRGKDENWVLDQFSDQLSKKIIIYQKEEKGHFLGDYSIFCNALHFYADIHGDLTKRAFERMDPHAHLLGWGDDEYQTIRKASEYDIGVLPADWAFNLSTLTNFDADTKQEPLQLQNTQIEDKHIACFLMSDGDNIQWLLNIFAEDPRWFLNPNRGIIPIGWTAPPTMSELAPTVLRKIYSLASNTTTGNDYFVAGPSGRSYLFPRFYNKLDEECEILDKYMEKADLRIINIIGTENTFHNVYQYTKQDHVDALFTYDYTNYGKYFGQIMCDGVKPIIAGKYNLWGGYESCRSIADKLNAGAKDLGSKDGYSLIPVHAWSYSVDSLLKIKSYLNDGVEIVSPQDFAQLVSDNICQTKSSIDRVYPNPNEGIFTLEVFKKLTNPTLRAYTISGEELLIDYQLSASHFQVFAEVELKTKYTGLVIVHLQSIEGNYSVKFMVTDY